MLLVILLFPQGGLKYTKEILKNTKEKSWNRIFRIYNYTIPDQNRKQQAFLWDMKNTKWCSGFYIEFKQSFAKETFSYDEHLKS